MKNAAFLALLFLAPSLGVAAEDPLGAGANAAFLAANAAKPGTIARPSGLQYRVLRSGAGKRPGGSDIIQLSYAIGVAKPLSIYVDLGDNASKVDTAKLETVLGELMDLSPRGIRKHLDLNKPIYARTSAYGHFGREPDKEGGFSWEKTDLADKLKSAMA